MLSKKVNQVTIRKKGDKYYCRFQYDGIRYERRCIGATDLKTAMQCETIIKSEIMRGNYDFGKFDKKSKISDIVKIYDAYARTNKISYNSDVSKIHAIEQFFGSATPLKKITPQQIENFKEHLKTYKAIEIVRIKNSHRGIDGDRKVYVEKQVEVIRTRTNSTINRYIEVLKRMFNIAIQNDLMISNPCSGIGKLRQNNFKIRFLTMDEQKRMFDCLNRSDAAYSYLKPLIVCALQTGMRKGEILSLQWHQVDFKNGFIELLKTKSGKARKIPISATLDDLLKQLFLDQKSEYVFINEKTKKPFVDVKKSFATLMRDAAIDNFRFHDLRHTCATRMVESGIDLAVVQEILGHASITTTMRYAHPVPERKKRAIDVLNSFCE